MTTFRWSPSIGSKPKDQPFAPVPFKAQPAPKKDADPVPEPEAITEETEEKGSLLSFLSSILSINLRHNTSEFTILRNPPPEAYESGCIRILDRDNNYRHLVRPTSDLHLLP